MLGVDANAPPELKLRRLMALSGAEHTAAHEDDGWGTPAMGAMAQSSAAVSSFEAVVAQTAGRKKPKCEGVVSVYMNGHPFHGPSGLDWDSHGNMWVTNDVTNSVLKVERTGGAVVFGTSGRSKGLFKRPLDIVINTHDVVYVTNIVPNSIVRIYPNGEVEGVVTGNPIAGPIGIETDSWDNIYVANSEDDKVLKIKYPSGPIVLYASSASSHRSPARKTWEWTAAITCSWPATVQHPVDSPERPCQYLRRRSTADSPRGIAVDSRDNVFDGTKGNEVFR